MTEEEYQRELEEAERLIRQINDTIDRINYLNRENAELEADLDLAIRNVNVLINNCGVMDDAVNADMKYLVNIVGQADISTKEVYQALNELTVQYFTFKRISSASKNVTQYTDEYNTKFFYYNELRRISLGYVIGLDMNLINGETMRKKVEKAYLQNTDYWLAYAISAVMLWASNEREAANRALSKSLSLSYFNSCLFYLLINLRFGRIDAAKKWFVNYLDRADTSDLGDDWQYLLQAYLFGAFGADAAFQKIVSDSFKNMLTQVEVTTVDFAKKFTSKAIEFAELYAHRTDKEYTILWRTCAEYSDMKDLLSLAEKNEKIREHYNSILNAESDGAKNLPQRIENVLYSLINDYDEEELKVVLNIKRNEATISAKGDEKLAQAYFDAAYGDRYKKKNMGDLLLTWAFSDETTQTDAAVRRFSISLMKEAIAKGFSQFVEQYRAKEKERYNFNIDDCMLELSENDYARGEKILDGYYDKNKLKDTLGDKQVVAYGAVCGVGVLLLMILFAFFSPVILTMGVLTTIAGGILLWRRIVDMGKILAEKKRKGKLLLSRALEELKQWSADYKAADAKYSEML